MVKLITLKCLRCGKVWVPRIPSPVTCPRCRSPYYNKPKNKQEVKGWKLNAVIKRTVNTSRRNNPKQVIAFALKQVGCSARAFVNSLRVQQKLKRMDRQQCSVKVSGEGQWGAFHQHQCWKQATVERDGKWYCSIHDPEYIKTKDEGLRKKAMTQQCPKCGSNPKSYWTYCPFCGTKYPPH